MKRRIVHIITGLPTGGSQMMLFKLLSVMDRESWDSEVISLRDVGVMGEKIASIGIPVRALGMHESLSDFAAVLRLTRWLRDRLPDLVQTWLYHADLIGGIAAWWAGRMAVVWGIRQGNLEPKTDRRSTIWIARTSARLSRHLPRRIVCCSEASRRFHAGMGYAEDKMVVIPNGFDLHSFHPDPQARASVRAELGLPANAPLIGLPARFHPQKDHRTFVDAAAQLHQALPDVHFVLYGDGMDALNRELTEWITTRGIQSRCHLLGRRNDIPRLMAALDIGTLSSSFGEGFPNAIGEAMACAVPCVVTDVGESASIVADTGRVVSPKDPPALANAWRELLDVGRETRARLGSAARRRVETEFDIVTIARRYSSLYHEMIERTAS